MMQLPHSIRLSFEDLICSSRVESTTDVAKDSHALAPRKKKGSSVAHGVTYDRFVEKRIRTNGLHRYHTS